MDKKDFYEKYREFRYKNEWHIPLFAQFPEAKGKSVLEIGCGNGADGVLFTISGANYTGVDLTKTAVDATQEHFETLNLRGIFQIENAEQLSFADNAFDIVYSYGVIHHTPHPLIAIREIHRVLKPNGKCLIMLYHKNSFNYYFRIMGYMRLRVLFKCLSLYKHWDSDREKIIENPMLSLQASNKKQIWNIHYTNFLKEGWKYFRTSNFVHHCTDGPDCPYAYVFTKSDVRKIFSMFKEIDMKVAHFPLRKYHFTGWVPLSVEKFIAPKIGWHLLVSATK